jgi:hypothetical protein
VAQFPDAPSRRDKKCHGGHGSMPWYVRCSLVVGLVVRWGNGKCLLLAGSGFKPPWSQSQSQCLLVRIWIWSQGSEPRAPDCDAASQPVRTGAVPVPGRLRAVHRLATKRHLRRTQIKRQAAALHIAARLQLMSAVLEWAPTSPRYANEKDGGSLRKSNPLPGG